MTIANAEFCAARVISLRKEHVNETAWIAGVDKDHARNVFERDSPEHWSRRRCVSVCVVLQAETVVVQSMFLSFKVELHGG